MYAWDLFPKDSWRTSSENNNKLCKTSVVHDVPVFEYNYEILASEVASIHQLAAVYYNIPEPENINE
mgnify:CR=1 FL=1